MRDCVSAAASDCDARIEGSISACGIEFRFGRFDAANLESIQLICELAQRSAALGTFSKASCLGKEANLCDLFSNRIGLGR